MLRTTIASRFVVAFRDTHGSGRATDFLAGRGPGCLVLRNLGGHVGLVTGSVILSGKISLLFGQTGAAKTLPCWCSRLGSGYAFLRTATAIPGSS